MEFIRANLGELGQKSFAPPKFCLLPTSMCCTTTYLGIFGVAFVRALVIQHLRSVSEH